MGIPSEQALWKMGIDADEWLAERDKQIIKNFINKLAEELYSRHSADSAWEEYSANTIIDEMTDISEKMIKSTK